MSCPHYPVLKAPLSSVSNSLDTLSMLTTYTNAPSTLFQEQDLGLVSPNSHTHCFGDKGEKEYS